MSKTKAWIHAARLRTLALALAGIILGSLLAMADGHFSWLVFILAIVTTLLLQILSNLANDYGDHKHGTDNENRVGPERAVQSGIISAKEMKRAIIVIGAITFISGISLLAIAFNGSINILFLTFLIIGLLAIVAAIKYTVGKSNYGYKGFGDIMVFVFFGLTSVFGSYFLQAQQINLWILIPAIAIGLLSTGVLNMNNMRDIENDKASGKHTMVVKMGITKSKTYHSILIILPIISCLSYTFIKDEMLAFAMLIIPSSILVKHLQTVYNTINPRLFDPELKRLSLTTLLFSLLLGLGMIL